MAPAPHPAPGTAPNSASGGAAPSAADLAAAFAAPDAAATGPVPIWWWSGEPVDLERLTWQMEQLLDQGVAQAVVMNLAPTGPMYGSLADDPAFLSEQWWALVSAACERASERGFRLWPYDQIGFSGANLQGRLVTEHPQWAGQALGRRQVDLDGTPARVTCPPGAHALAAYVVPAQGPAQPVDVVDGSASCDGAGQRLVLVFAQEKGFDYYDADACATLIDTVHGEWARRLGSWFGTVIPGFFQDELPNMPTWGPRFAQTFAQRHGYDLVAALPALWDDEVELADATGTAVRAARVRLDYHAQRAASARETFFDPLARWFTGHGLVCGFDQQSLAREGDPAGATSLYGDYTGTHATFGVPGSDHWGDPKLHSSLAQAHGHTRTWIEAFHSSGWGGTLEETYDWLAPFLRRGATLYDPHAVYYATPGGWWEWAPPSTCWRQPYWPDYHVFSTAVARLCALFATGTLVTDTILLFPTTTAQAGSTLDGALPSAKHAGSVYAALNGRSVWYREQVGELERRGIDHSVFDEAVLASAERGPAGSAGGAVLRVGGTEYRTVVLPDVDALSAQAAAVLADFAADGGRVVVVGDAPRWFPGEGDGGERFTAAVADGTVLRVAGAADVAAAVVSGPLRVEADVPAQLRRVGDAVVVGLFAHDGVTGTRQPMMTSAVDSEDLILASWDVYWDEAHTTGYDFRPVTDRRATVVLHGIQDADEADQAGGAEVGVQQWDPSTGARRPLASARREDGALVVEPAFDDGSVAVLVVGADLPAPTHPATGEVTGTVAIDGWTLEAESSLDNRYADLGPRDRRGILPVQVWRLEAAEGGSQDTAAEGGSQDTAAEGGSQDTAAEGGSQDTAADGDAPRDWAPVTATYGPFAAVTGPHAQRPTGDPGGWTPAHWSLSRGIEDDPVHGETLGPKGYVPEEFLHWDDVPSGAWVAVRTTLDVPAGGLHLVVGAAAAKHVLVDGEPVALDGEGYWAAGPVQPGTREVRLDLCADVAGPLRASFALVADLEAYARPEWLAPADGSRRASTVEVRARFTPPSGLLDARIQVGSEQPCTVVLNGTEVGRQGAFDPYEERRFARFHPYDLTGLLREGENELLLRSTDNGMVPAVLVDSVPRSLHGLGLRTGEGTWSLTRDGAGVPGSPRRLQWQDPRFACLVARPHPLPAASWLEEPPGADGVVVASVPDAAPGEHRTQWLRLLLPIGATALRVPTPLVFTAGVDGTEVAVTPGAEGIHVVALPAPAPAGSVAVLRFAGAGGRRGGALLDGPIDVEVAPVAAELADWDDLGLATFGGCVHARSQLTTPRTADGERLQLDLGVVRGSASVRVDGAVVTSLAWSPYRVDLTDVLGEPGSTHELDVVVRGTLAGYLSAASPTPAVFAGQERGGLRGPVTLRTLR